MRNEFTAIIEPGDDGWLWARSPEVPGANGQGRTPEEAREDLVAAIDLVLEYQRGVGDGEAPPAAIRQFLSAS
ncbi:MAG: type II toxin-antitoxin system HicB family antitoxin [Dehalococcoidia bacterium]